MPVAPGFSAVLPGGTMKVGHLYFSGKGRFPGFYDAKGQLFSEFCWKDYDADAVLMTVAQFVEEEPDPMAGFTGAAKGSASFALPEVLSAEASASTDAKVSGIKRLTLSAAGVTAVAWPASMRAFTSLLRSAVKTVCWPLLLKNSCWP